MANPNQYTPAAEHFLSPEFIDELEVFDTPETEIVDFKMTYGSESARAEFGTLLCEELNTSANDYIEALWDLIHPDAAGGRLGNFVEQQAITESEQDVTARFYSWLKVSNKHVPEMTTQVANTVFDFMDSQFSYDDSPLHGEEPNDSLNLLSKHVSYLAHHAAKHFQDAQLAERFMASDLRKTLIDFIKTGLVGKVLSGGVLVTESNLDDISKVIDASIKDIGLIHDTLTAEIAKFSPDQFLYLLSKCEDDSIESVCLRVSTHLATAVIVDDENQQRLLDIIQQNLHTPRSKANMVELLAQYGKDTTELLYDLIQDPAVAADQTHIYKILWLQLPDTHLLEFLNEYPNSIDPNSVKEIAVRRLAGIGCIDEAIKVASSKTSKPDLALQGIFPIINLLAIYEETGNESAWRQANKHARALVGNKYNRIENLNHVIAVHRYKAATMQGNGRRIAAALNDMEQYVHKNGDVDSRREGLLRMVRASAVVGDLDKAEEYALRVFNDELIESDGDKAILYVIRGHINNSQYEKAREFAKKCYFKGNRTNRYGLDAIRILYSDESRVNVNFVGIQPGILDTLKK